MTETAATYTVTDMTETAKSDQKDHALEVLSMRVAVHYMTLRYYGVEPKSARFLTDNYQMHLLSLE